MSPAMTPRSLISLGNVFVAPGTATTAQVGLDEAPETAGGTRASIVAAATIRLARCSTRSADFIVSLRARRCGFFGLARRNSWATLHWRLNSIREM
jgi:hypothetical protein